MLSLQLFGTRRDSASRDTVMRTLIELAVLADQLGFSAVWLAEHHDTDWNLCADPLTLLAVLAERTDQIRLGAAVVNLALHEPARIAEQAAMVNALAGGRLELGIGKGFSAADYLKYGIDPGSADSVFCGKHERLCAMLCSDPDTSTMPVWLASSGNPATICAAAEHGHGLLLAATGEKLAVIARQIAAGPARPRVGLMRVVHTAPTPGAARRQLRPYLAWYIDAMSRLQPGVPAPAPGHVLDTFCVTGPPLRCREALEDLRREHAVTEIIAVPGIGGMSLPQTSRVLRDLASATGTA